MAADCAEVLYREAYSRRRPGTGPASRTRVRTD